MYRIKIYYRMKDDTSCILIKGRIESVAFDMMYKIINVLNKNNISYIVFCKKGLFSFYTRLFTVEYLKRRKGE